jgi:signal transduction histidine kinase
VFEPFFTTKAKGTGLGMPIARKMIEAHGGQISVGNESSTGAEFVIILMRATHD